MTRKAESKMPGRGRPEKLDEELARKIVRLIEVMPDMDVEVSWANVIALIKKKFDVDLGRRVLSMKQWGGQPLIAQAFDRAKDVQKTLRAQGKTRRHSTAPRAVLQQRLETEIAKRKAAERRIEEMALQTYDKLDTLRWTRFDLRKEAQALGGPEGAQS
ncbi:hypothetical protein GCM10025771_34540 [Niveibacterium umoris]|uniref:Uncharacterized protein n=1 Tax=Niveibacterium umoris TaxID=1193620 RepID=A0A840BIF2_9RHOO|nr:hypothetical protein [Niveibacterium umoris]MBB4011352.1 hypothetical protein [Niveibacterium umoris]